MDSSSSRSKHTQRKQDEIRRQIAFLQAQLCDGQQEPVSLAQRPSSPKRKYPDSTLLVPATPSPKKRKLEHNTKPGPTRPVRNIHQNSNALPQRQEPSRRHGSDTAQHLPIPLPSTVINKLAALDKTSTKNIPPVEIVRSTAFTEKPKPPPPLEGAGCDAPKRDDRLALIEDLEVGPYNHVPPFDDPNFNLLEPHSSIRLTSRTVPHDDIQEYLFGRYYLSPSRLYSVIRLLPDKQGYDVPVAGDWVTIAVVAERGQVKTSRAPVGLGPGDGGDETEQRGPGRASGKNSDPKGKKDASTSGGKKYVNFKLIDFGARSKSSSSATGGKAVIRGDAFLSLLLFESDGYDLETRDGGGKTVKVYRGGSRGAFEAMSKVKEGDVIALLNPRILKPFQRTTDKPHPTNNILALTPESASSIVVIGRSRDLGMCTVMKRDGKVCGGWCDKRVSDVCEWHLENAVQRRRAGRAEFTTGTSGMSHTSAPKRKKNYDPERQWGFKPSEPERGPTYVLSGHIVSEPGSGFDTSSMYVTESIGREGQAKAKRKLANKDADKALKALLERDKEGMKAVVKAREVALKDDQGVKVDKRGKGQSDTKKRRRRDEDASDVPIKDVELNTLKNSYSAEVIKQLGFDPAAKASHRRANDMVVQKKLDALAAAQSSLNDIELGPRPGKRIRSGVILPSRPRALVPETPNPEPKQTVLSTTMVDLDDL